MSPDSVPCQAAIWDPSGNAMSASTGTSPPRTGRRRTRIDMPWELFTPSGMWVISASGPTLRTRFQPMPAPGIVLGMSSSSAVST